jgi:putative nucleotidyltransferase with HDIG domain
MPCSKEELETRERQMLASYAQLSGETRGRVYAEPPPSWRTEYQRDRDRVIHSRAFRRLEYKTQVFLNGTGDHLRTRLTHTIEVAAMARSLARALRLNEDLAETIALAHDLGHSPFGHRGEAVLNKLMREHGGFEHNRQSLRIVEELEEKYPGFRGLNLTWEVREGLIKHQTTYDQPGLRKGFTAKSPRWRRKSPTWPTNSSTAATIWTTGWRPACFRKRNCGGTSAFSPRPGNRARGTRPNCPPKSAATSSSVVLLTTRCATWSRPAKRPFWLGRQDGG